MKQSDYIILTDASTSLSIETLSEYGIKVIPTQFFLGKDTFLRFPDDREISKEDVFRRLRGNEQGGTTHVTIAMYLNTLRPYLDEGKDILIVTPSSGFSVNFSKAFVAANKLITEYPKRHIKVLDSFSGGSSLDLLLCHLGENHLSGMGMEENYQAVYDEVSYLHTWVLADKAKYVTNRSFLKDTVKNLAFSLGMKGFVHIDQCGIPTFVSPVSGKKEGAGNHLIAHIASTLDEHTKEIFILYDPTSEQHLDLEKKLKERFPELLIRSASVSPVLGVRVGPDFLMVGYLGQKRNIRRPI